MALTLSEVQKVSWKQTMLGSFSHSSPLIRMKFILYDVGANQTYHTGFAVEWELFCPKKQLVLSWLHQKAWNIATQSDAYEQWRLFSFKFSMLANTVLLCEMPFWVICIRGHRGTRKQKLLCKLFLVCCWDLLIWWMLCWFYLIRFTSKRDSCKGDFV